MREKQIEAELRLFKSYTLDEYAKIDDLKDNTISIQKCILYSDVINDSIRNIAENIYGINAEQLNATFHKSFGTILDTPIETLVAQQILHYFSTYGLESLNLYDSGLVYLPKEKLTIPDIENDLVLTYIKQIDTKELEEKLLCLANSGIALSKQTVLDIMELSDYISKDKIYNIKNRELKLALYEKYDIFPENSMEFLKYVVFKITKSTLYIKNKQTINLIKTSDKQVIYNYFNQYVSKSNGYKSLAEIFLRNKKIFLAFKTKNSKDESEKNMNTIINKISKLSKKYHKPLKENILDELASMKSIKVVNTYKDDILKLLDTISVYREIRIVNGLRYRIEANSYKNTDINLVYRVRNGKVYAKKDNRDIGKHKFGAQELCLDIVYNHLINRLKPMIKDKIFYIPDNVIYTVPTSEKQFVENIPEGTIVKVDRQGNMVFGVHWNNLEHRRVDLDLKLLNLTNSYGWDTAYYSDLGDIIFSGDVTDATLPNGATEVFLIKPSFKNKSFLIKLNDFTQVKQEIPFEFFISNSNRETIYQDYMVDPNKVILQVNNKFDNTDKNVSTPAKTLGYLKIGTQDIQLIFRNFNDVKGRISNMDQINEILFKYAESYNNVQLKLNEVIIACGGKIINEPNIEKLEPVDVDGKILYNKVNINADFNLSLNNIAKDSIINIIEGK